MSRRLLMLLVVIGIIWGGCSMGGGKAKEVQEGMQKYLQDTYGMEFVVGKPYMYGNEGTGYNYQAKAYPKGKPELEFFVEGDKFNTGVYIDGYLQVKWTYQGRQQLEKALKEVYGDDYYLDHYEFLYNNKEFKDLDYDEVLGQPGHHGYVDIRYYVFDSNEYVEKEVEVQHVHQIVKRFIAENRAASFDFNVYYLPASYKNRIKEFNDEFEVKGKSKKELYKEGKLINYLRLEGNLVKDNLLTDFKLKESFAY